MIMDSAFQNMLKNHVPSLWYAVGASKSFLALCFNIKILEYFI
jgi:hypothetical protein